MTTYCADHAFPTRAHVAPVVVFLLSVLSLGIYVPVWYLLRRETLNRLADGPRLSPVPAVALLALLLADQLGLFSPLAAHSLDGMLLLSGLGAAQMLVGAVLLLVLRLRALRRLSAACAGRTDVPPPSRFATLLVGEAYLQARLNTLTTALGAPPDPAVALATAAS